MDGQLNGWMDGWMDGQTDTWMDGWMDGRIHGWTDGWTLFVTQSMRLKAIIILCWRYYSNGNHNKDTIANTGNSYKDNDRVKFLSKSLIIEMIMDY